jgi:hypothetical protein
MTDWVTISSLATAAGTLVLAAATFASVRSANRAARAAERSLLAGLRPLLVPSRPQDPPEKIGFADDKWVLAPGGGGVAEIGDAAVYFAMPLRNVGSGIAVLHGWRFSLLPGIGTDGHPPESEFHRLSRDLYVPVADRGFWQGAIRDQSDPDFEIARTAIEARQILVIDILYGDYEGGQRMITRFTLRPWDDGGWIAGASRHWHLDRRDPR